MLVAPFPMNLASGYLGLSLRSPFVVGASPLCDEVSTAVRCEEAGAGAVVMRSLFEEQMRPPEKWTDPVVSVSGYQRSTEAYLKQLRALKRALSIPVIASLNGHRPGTWLEIAPRLEQMGADAIELNFYQIVADPATQADHIETEMLQTVGEIVGCVGIPVAVKISPFHGSVAQLAIALELEGAAGVVIFNRFFQPDVDPHAIGEKPRLHLSEPGELLLRLRWLAILSPLLRTTIAAGGGVYTSEDVLKVLLSGAHAVQLVSALLRGGPAVISTLREGLELWMKQRGHENLETFRGQLNLGRVENPAAFERANYIRVLQSWKV